MKDKQVKFYSIKWKAFILFGTLLFIVSLSFPLLVYWNLHQNLDFSRKQIQKQYQHELMATLTSSSEHIQSIAEWSLIPNGKSVDSIIRNLSKNQSQLEINLQVTQAHLFNSQAKQIYGWGEPPPAVLNMVSEVAQLEQATTIINCVLGCQQFEFLPVLIDDSTSHVLLLAHDLTEALVNFTRDKATDLAVLSRATPVNINNNQQVLPNWGVSVHALSSFKDNIDILKNFSDTYPLEELKAKRTLYSSQPFPVEFSYIQFENMDDLIFLFIEDVSKQYKDIIETTSQSLVIALSNIIVFGTALFLFLSRPLLRLSAVSDALPLLAEKQYGKVKSLIKTHSQHGYLDELSQLEASTYALSSQLEQLNTVLDKRTETARQKTVELRHERDFIKSVIDSAQLIIITLDEEGKITSFNDYAEHITGLTEHDVLHTDFKMLFPDDQKNYIELLLIALDDTSPKDLSQHESVFIQPNGEERIISWLHSRIDSPANSSVILTVGIDITEKKQHEQKIIWLAEHDTLTGLYNRHQFNIEFNKILSQTKQFDHSGVLLFLDLDQFKDINDRSGHDAGDYVLGQVAKVLASITRETDIVARLGGDEFAIILPETTSDDAIRLAENISANLTKLNITLNEVQYKITCSIGIVGFPYAGLSIGELISNADLAMYEAKKRGKNTWHLFSLDSESRQELETRVLWKQRIEEALENDRFIFYYQPIMDIRTRAVSHYEVLLRLVDIDGTVYDPGIFIKVAEQTGLIHEIDHWVLRQGILKQASLDADERNISLSLNLSGYAVDDTFLSFTMEELLEQSEAKPEHLLFELTETAAVADIVQAKAFMTRMKQLGCHFSLDDFGTGFSSFRYMRELPLDYVKIDGSFITNLVNNPDDQLFVKALVDVAKGMGKKTIAEFVENAETLALLHAYGVDYAQGYFIGKPSPDFLTKAPELK